LHVGGRKSSQYYETEKVLCSEKKVTEPILRYRNLEYNSRFFIATHAYYWRNFYNPNIDEAVIQQHANKFITEVNSRLESRVESSDKYIRIPFMHTIYFILLGRKLGLQKVILVGNFS